MLQTWTRRDLMCLAVTLPVGAFLSNLKLLAQPHIGKLKITGIRAVDLNPDFLKQNLAPGETYWG